MRVGFFLGKASRITNLAKMQDFVCARLTKIAPSSLPPFQLIHNTLGPRDTITRSKAIMVECSRRDAGFLRSALEKYFSSTSKYPFISFQVLFHLSDTAKLRYYREHKNRTDGEYIIEIPFPSEFAHFGHPDHYWRESHHSLRLYFLTTPHQIILAHLLLT